MDLKNKKIGVLMGGFSSEREISLRSGRNVLAVLQEGGYNAVAVDVQDDLLDVLKREAIEVAFNVLHGEFGEDGRIQAILDFMGIAYTGSGFQASNIGMNKILSKKMAVLAGVTTADFKMIYNSEDIKKVSFAFPWVLKPVSEGSSIGVELVKNIDQANAYSQNGKACFVEEFIEGIEITVGVLDDGKEPIVLPVLQLVPQNEFYDFESKYTKGMTNFILPAEIPAELYKKAQEDALKVHRAVGCCGASRSDFIVKDGELYFLEVNTNPGMTETSDIPAQAKAHGMTNLELCEKILASALISEKK